MSLESASARRNKRIVEHIIGGFKSANEAIVFGNTVESVIQGKVKGFVKFRQHIGAPNTTIAITEDWKGDTVLKTMFLEISDQNTAAFIVDSVKTIISKHEEIHKCVLNIINEVVREKPQPQRIG